MRERYKTKGQLISEIESLRRRVNELESLEKKLEDEEHWPERALHEIEKKYEALIDTNLYAIQEIDIYGIITYMNSVFYKILGYKMGELKGKQIWDLLVNDADRDRLTEYLTRIAEGEYASFPWTGEYLRQNGETVKLQVDWNHRKDTQGRITGFISVISSILDGRPLGGKMPDEIAAEEDLEQEEETEAAEDLEDVPSMAERVDELAQMMRTLHREFQSKIKHDTQKDTIIERLQRILLERKPVPVSAAPSGEASAEQISTPRILEDDDLDEIREIREELGQLRNEFSEKIKFDAHKNGIIDKLHEDLQEYKGDILKKYLQSIIMDIIQIVDNLRKLANHYVALDPSEIDPNKLLEILKNIPSDLEDLFYRHGVRPFTGNGDEFDPSRQRVLKTLVTEDEEQDKRVAESLHPGYEWDGQVIRPEMVAAHIYKKKK